MERGCKVDGPRSEFLKSSLPSFSPSRFSHSCPQIPTSSFPVSEFNVKQSICCSGPAIPFRSNNSPFLKQTNLHGHYGLGSNEVQFILVPAQYFCRLLYLTFQPNLTWWFPYPMFHAVDVTKGQFMWFARDLWMKFIPILRESTSWFYF